MSFLIDCIQSKCLPFDDSLIFPQLLSKSKCSGIVFENNNFQALGRIRNLSCLKSIHLDCSTLSNKE